MIQKVGICPGCDNSRTLVKSHIIPSAINMTVRGGGNNPPLVLAKKIPIPYKGKSQTGIYEYILCSSCDNGVLGKYDMAGVNIIKKFNVSAGNLIKKYKEWSVVDFDFGNYIPLHKFIISVLWRAHHSSDYMFAKVCLGPFERRVRDYLFSNTNTLFSDIFIRYFDDPLANFQYDPYLIRINNVNYWVLPVGLGFQFYIKMDRRAGQLNDIQAFQASGLVRVIIDHDFINRKEFRYLSDFTKLFT